ncbi:MAG: glycosyltransferase family 4 protein [Ferruginibacter sp.]|uniref:glycosyltransferase family 4 protein n=1 Tax=Ferruginibacter sp. TaxID=1940288 RepID=UPI00265940EF|nr:glycosyltransferase family 4 protein [Ferruginibacter sp.]MDB5280337.1 glycosyltransferase family 4 protein [Ferruginibacter sp.]
MHNTTLFLTLRVFSATGGIEKVCRVAGKAMNELFEQDVPKKITIYSLYDESADINTAYFPATIFRGFGKNRFRFFNCVFKKGFGCERILLSHVNLLLIGYIIKLCSPKTKLVLMAHGIEVWQAFPWWKRMALRKCDLILAVSQFTKQKLIVENNMPENKITVLNNCLDPFLPVPLTGGKPVPLLERYGIEAADKVVLTLTRMAYNEQYKGYEQVIRSVSDLKKSIPCIKYLLVGKYDAAEKARLDALISRLGVQQNIVFSGFIPDAELAAHYALADLYIMPSQKEGFGIVFIEAMFYGKPVIAGNADGSVDALQNGKLGILVDPNNQQQITEAIEAVLSGNKQVTPATEEVQRYFGFEAYKQKLKAVLQ